MSLELAKRNLMNNEPMLMLEYCKDDISRWFIKSIYDLQNECFDMSVRVDELETLLQDLLDRHMQNAFLHPTDAYLIKEALKNA